MQKPVLYDEKIGWQWHKSWNIPNISVELLQPLPNKAWAQIFATKLKKEESGKAALLDVGLKGFAKKDLTKQSVTFAGLKFITTSYYHEVFSRIS